MILNKTKKFNEALTHHRIIELKRFTQYFIYINYKNRRGIKNEILDCKI